MKQTSNIPNCITVLGPTASGKTRLAVAIASTFNGEIISADSRQVYRGMDIGTGKDLHEYRKDGGTIPYHLIDIIEPTDEYNLFRFLQDFSASFTVITAREKLPVIAGGSGMYLAALLKNYRLITNTLSPEEESYYESLDEDALRELLFSLQPELHNVTDSIDRKRILSALAIAVSAQKQKRDELILPSICSVTIGVRFERSVLRERILLRLNERLANGMIEEVEQLMTNGTAKDKLIFFGLEYRWIAEYLCGGIDYETMHAKLYQAIGRFAKRQMTMFRKLEREGVQIHWLPEPDIDAALRIINKAGLYA